jgi:hypothetical protein
VIGYIPYLIGAVLVVVAHFVREDALNPVAYFGGALSVPVLAIAFLLVWFIADGMFRTTTFNSPVWKTNSTADTDWPARLRMVDDLLNKHDLHGRRRSEIVALLGPPDETDKWADWDLVYWLGPERGFIRIDSEWLVFKLGTNDEVVEYSVVVD